MLKLAVCDDDELICAKIERMLLEYTKQFWSKVEVEVFTKGEELIEALRKDICFHFIFLDIELGKTTGVDIGKFIRTELQDYVTQIIFVSGKMQYDRLLFAVNPFFFIEKPINDKQLYHCIKAMKTKMDKLCNYFQYSKSAEIINVPLNDVIYFESEGNQIHIVQRNKTDKFYGTLEEIKKKLPPFFIAPHRSYLVNYENIERITSTTLFMKHNDQQIPISRRRLKEIRELQMKDERIF